MMTGHPDIFSSIIFNTDIVFYLSPIPNFEPFFDAHITVPSLVRRNSTDVTQRVDVTTLRL
jgi:hypothetical protein